MKSTSALAMLILSLFVLTSAQTTGEMTGEVYLKTWQLFDREGFSLSLSSLAPTSGVNPRYEVHVEAAEGEGVIRRYSNLACFEADEHGNIPDGANGIYFLSGCYTPDCGGRTVAVMPGSAEYSDEGSLGWNYHNAYSGPARFQRGAHNGIFTSIFDLQEGAPVPKIDAPDQNIICFTKMTGETDQLFDTNSFDGYESVLIGNNEPVVVPVEVEGETVIDTWNLVTEDDHDFSVGQLEPQDGEPLRYAFVAKLPQTLGGLETSTTICFQANDSGEVEDGAAGWALQWLCGVSGGCQSNLQYHSYFFVGTAGVESGEVYWQPETSIDNASFYAKEGDSNTATTVVTFDEGHGLPATGGSANFKCYMETGGTFGETFALLSYRVDEWDLQEKKSDKI